VSRLFNKVLIKWRARQTQLPLTAHFLENKMMTSPLRLAVLLLASGLMFTIPTGHADMAVIVSAKSNISSLDKSQISDIFLGKAATYPDGSQAVPIEQAEGAAVREEFHNLVTDKSGSQLKSYWSKMVFSGKGNPPKEVPNSAEMLKLIAANPNLIGYVEKGAVNASVKSLLAQ
jgi:ABC-type phosphate transport system substrate-binding protein